MSSGVILKSDTNYITKAITMPTLPHNTKCAAFNCKEEQSKLNSFCLDHGGKKTTPLRFTDKRYQSPAWRSIRRRQLSLQPLCQACLTRGHVCAAVHVDHLFPWVAVGGASFINNVFQSLCQPCHSHKTGLEQRGIIEHYGLVVTEYTIEDYGFVLGSVKF